jgi:tetratricopeptide (TPR) repeat protein
LKINPSDPVSHYVLGTIYLQRDLAQVPEAWDKAQQEFEAALNFDPALGAAHTALANVSLFKGENQKALEYAQKGIELATGAPDPYSYWALAQAQCALGDRAGTAESIKTINGLKPTDPLFIQQVQALAERCK